MGNYIKLLFLVICSGGFMTLSTYSYCSYMFGKYGKAEEYYNKFIRKPSAKQKNRIWKENPSRKELNKILKKNDYYKQKETLESKKLYIRENCLIIRNFKSKAEKEYYYSKNTTTRKRFDFFINLSKINLIITIILITGIIINIFFNIFYYKILKYVIIAKVILIDCFSLLCCLQFGYLGQYRFYWKK